MQFKNVLGAALLAAFVMLLAGCGGGKGVDARLSTTNEPEYRKSLAIAWQDMSEEQQTAYNWAVSGMDLYQVLARFPDSTPRKVVTVVADKYIADTSAELKKLETDFAADLPKLNRQEKELADIRAELAKITVISAKLDHKNEELIYTTDNKSRYNLSTAGWQVWVIADGQMPSNRSMYTTGDYGRALNGLDSGTSGQLKELTGFYRDKVHSVGIKRAKSVVVQMDLDPESVQDLQGHPILPKFDVSKADYTRVIRETRTNIAAAKKFKKIMGSAD